MARTSRASTLTAKQDLFVKEYLKDLNATRAYKAAGYKVKNDNSAAASASTLLRVPKVAAAVQAAQSRRADRLEVTADRVVAELARIAFSDLRRVVRWGPKSGVKIRPSSKLTDEDAAAIESISESKTKDGGSIRVKLHSKPQALQKLGEMLGLFKDRDPLEAILALLPPAVGAAVRGELARALSDGGAAAGGQSGPT